jgi:DNA-binding IclR family transcriptional regulator
VGPVRAKTINDPGRELRFHVPPSGITLQGHSYTWNDWAVADTLQSVHQALRILTLLQRHDELGVTQIANELSLGKSSTYRLLSTLKDARYVDQTPSRGYRLGPEMSSSPEAASVKHCADIAEQHLVRLRDETGETVHVGVLNGRFIEFVAVSESKHMVRVSSRIGFTVPAHTSAAGKILLSTMTESQLDTLYPPGSELETLTGQTISTREQLRDELDVVRRLGYARNVSESEVGLYALAVILPRPSGRPVCTLALTGPMARISPGSGKQLSASEEDLLAKVRETAEDIAAELRY